MSAGGVVFLDHTADVGFEVDAPAADLLFHQAGLAMLALLRGAEDEIDGGGVGDGRDVDPPETDGPSRSIVLHASDPPRLLADWLRELLFLHEVERLDYRGAEFRTLDLPHAPSPPRPCRLEARVDLVPGGHAVREIKGVTYHEILARPMPRGWHARVIFDV